MTDLIPIYILVIALSASAALFLRPRVIHRMEKFNEAYA
jgi:hypothetical protein